MRNRKHILLTGLLAFGWGCQDVRPPAATPSNKTTPQPVTVLTPKASRTPPVIRTMPLPQKPTPKKTQPPKTTPVLAWRYDAKACMDIMDKAKDRANKVTYGSKKDDLYDEFSNTRLTSYKDAITTPPKGTIGAFEFEEGDGCMDYETQLTYVWRRATTPKYTRDFIIYNRRPGWMLKHFASTRNDTDKFPSSTKITALYRGPFIIYEIDFQGTRRSFKHQLRKGILRCFWPAKPTKI